MQNKPSKIQWRAYVFAVAAGSAIFMHAQQTTPKCADDLALHGPISPTSFSVLRDAANSLNLSMPETVEALRIKRPYLRISTNIVIVRVSDEEWAKLVATYPKDALQNADSSADLVFMAPKAK